MSGQKQLSGSSSPAANAVSAPTAEAADALRELRQVQRELVERDLVRRSDAFDSVQDALEGLSEIGSSTGILQRAAEGLGASFGFERVLISRLDQGRLVPHSLWVRGGTPAELLEKLRGIAIELRYPLVEAELAQRGEEAVEVRADGPRSPAELRALLGWASYAVAPMRLRGAVIGLLHAEPQAGTAADEDLVRELAGTYAKGLTAAFERAVLWETIQRHRDELRSAVDWMGGHLDDDLLGIGGLLAASPSAAAPEGEALTPREAEVLEMLGRGRTNRAIAASLLISESTVKFHVKNILLKLGATSRADAVARHLRGTA
jgi:DNA-binding CsgD family transcriptional regulator